jgi:hypothetical protein
LIAGRDVGIPLFRTIPKIALGAIQLNIRKWVLLMIVKVTTEKHNAVIV